MFAVMPAADTKISPRRGGFRLAKLTGTGFAHPNPKRKSIVVPTGSKWRRGSRVSLPNHRAVESPILSATHPCATSWIIME